MQIPVLTITTIRKILHFEPAKSADLIWSEFNKYKGGCKIRLTPLNEH